MQAHTPTPLSASDLNQRRRTVKAVARSLGFVGRVEYRHVYSQTGGAQYGRGTRAGSDLLTVFAEAFDRDANPADFSMKAIIAHERGHQLLARHPRLSLQFGAASLAAEEVLASLVGAMLLGEGTDQNNLIAKATVEVLAGAETTEAGVRLINSLWEQLEDLL
jgi:hypothetical protein